MTTMAFIHLWSLLQGIVKKELPQSRELESPLFSSVTVNVCLPPAHSLPTPIPPNPPNPNKITFLPLQNRGERIVFWWPNTNTNIIRLFKNDRIRILFGLKKATEYEYEYYSVWKNGPNTNTNIICLEKITRIRIRILVLGLNYSNNIQIPNYSLTPASH